MDTPVPGAINPVANVKVHKLWTEQQIAETEARIKRLEADAEELLKGKLKTLEAEVIMLKRKAAMLYDKFDKLEAFGNEEVIDVRGATVQRLEHKGG
jgi:hypothetical protein